MESTIQVRLSKKLEKQLEKWATLLNRTKEGILREAIIAKIDYLENKYLNNNSPQKP